MRRRLIGALVSLCSIPAAQAVTPPRVCPPFPDTPTAPEGVDQFYASLAVQAVRAALAGDTATLTKLVAPDAQFELFRGTYATSARARGTAGAVEMVRDLDAVSFQSWSIRTGTTIFEPAKCTWAVDVLFRTAAPGRGVLVKFSFADGLLVRARGDEVSVREGPVP